MRRFPLCLLPLALAACSADSLTAPRDIPEPRSAVGSVELDSYASAPCERGITSDLGAWHSELGDPSAIVAGASGDTSWVRVEYPAPAEYAAYYDGRVWQEYAWVSGWGYCMAVRSVGMPNPYE